MRRFSPSEAAFEGFRLIGRRPGSTLAWMLVNLAGAALLATLFWSIIGPELPVFLGQIQAGSSAGLGLQAAQSVNVFNPFSQIITYLVLVMINCAVFRAVLYPDERSFGYLRIGGDEFRVGVIKFAYNFCGAFAAALLGLGLFALIILAIAAAGGGQGPAAMPLVTIVVGAVLLAVAAVIGTRLSLAEVMTFDSQRLQFFDSWALTRGVFWRMLSAYVLAWLMALVMSLALLVVLSIPFAAWWMLTPSLHEASHNWSALQPLVVPAGMTWLTLFAVVGAVSRVLMSAPAAYIYAALTDQPDACELPAVAAGQLVL